MIEELKNTKLAEKVGGNLKLTVLIQKRLRELVHGARPLIENTQGKTQLEIVVQEIAQDKIALQVEIDNETKDTMTQD